MRWIFELAVLAGIIAGWTPAIANPVAGSMPITATAQLRAPVGRDQIHIGLLTYGPAGTIMSQYGHAAIVVFDGEGRSELYELAAESPDHRYSLPWYLTPQKLIYRSERGPLSATLHGAFLQLRDVQLRVLNLSDEQQTKLASRIAREMLPERAHFEFGVYTQNCTTRIRDLLNDALGGQLRRQLGNDPATMSYRDHSLRAFASNPLIAIGLDLSLGRLSDYTPTRWDESFYPESLALALDELSVSASSNGTTPIVKSVSTILVGEPTLRMAPMPPDFTPGLAATGAGLLLLLLLGRRLNQPIVRAAEGTLLAFFGLVGLFLLYLWFVGGEPVASWNENVLLFNPLLLMFVTSGSDRIKKWSSMLVLASVSLAVLLKFVPHAQANIGWILFAGPSIVYLTFRWNQLSRLRGQSSGDLLQSIWLMRDSIR